MVDHRKKLLTLVAGALALCMCTVASAATVPFTEDFSADAAGWVDGASGPLVWNATGGPDGGAFVLSIVNFSALPDGGAAIGIRGKESLGASGGAFAGDWISSGVTDVQLMVRHDAGFPLPFFVRLAPAAGFPGSNLVMTDTVPSGVWTLLDFPVDALSPNLILEGGSFEMNFANISRVQIGANVPVGMGGLDQNITLSFDKVSIVPEPATIMFVAVGIAAMGLRRRRESVRRC